MAWSIKGDVLMIMGRKEEAQNAYDKAEEIKRREK
jgi:predicted negative regulator of RcsB-dependent stress response